MLCNKQSQTMYLVSNIAGHCSDVCLFINLCVFLLDFLNVQNLFYLLIDFNLNNSLLRTFFLTFPDSFMWIYVGSNLHLEHDETMFQWHILQGINFNLCEVIIHAIFVDIKTQTIIYFKLAIVWCFVVT